ncbi:unnamed protein product, partial [Symbiodinium microadriaticum]
FHIEVQEKVESLHGILQEERVLQVDRTERVEVIREVPKPIVEYVNKEVPRFETRAVEKVVEVPTVLHQEIIVEVPEVQVAEAIREMPNEMTQQAVKEVPRYEMEYVQKELQVTGSVPAMPSAMPTVTSPQTYSRAISAPITVGPPVLGSAVAVGPP